MKKYERKNCYDIGDIIKLKSKIFLEDLPIDTFYGGDLNNAGKEGVVKKVIQGTNPWYEVDIIGGEQGIWAQQAVLGALVKEEETA
jgi:hypothetical protein